MIRRAWRELDREQKIAVVLFEGAFLVKVAILVSLVL